MDFLTFPFSSRQHLLFTEVWQEYDTVIRLLTHPFYSMCWGCLILPMATFYTVILEDQFVWQFKKIPPLSLEPFTFPFPSSLQTNSFSLNGWVGEKHLWAKQVAEWLYLRQYFSEVRIRKRIDDHRQGGLWWERLLGEKAGCLTWWEALVSEDDCGSVSDFFFFFFHLAIWSRYPTDFLQT